MEHPFRSLRKRIDLTLDQVAEITGVSKASLSRIETGEQCPSFDVIRTLISFSSAHGGVLTATDFVNFAPRADRASRMTADP
jgi:transcriptional regulator with XRE-family HTH domain